MSTAAAVAPREERVPALETVVRSGGLEVIDELADRWRALCREAISDEPFFRPEWIRAYLDAFAPEARLRVLTTTDDGGRLRAVLPLVRRSGLFAGIPARILESPSNVHSVRFDLVRAAADGDATLAAIWSALKLDDDWDVIALKDVPAGGSAERLMEIARADGWPVGQWDADQTPVVATVGVSDPLTLVHQGHFRANLRRRRRKASDAWPVTLQRIDSADRAALETFYAIEASGWKGRAGTAIDSSPSTRRFYDTAAAAAARHGYLSLYILRFGDEPVAGFFGFFYGRRYYTPKIGFDERYAAFSPGHLLVESMLRDAIARGIVELDFLGPSMPWKLQWTSTVRPHAHCYIFRRSVHGRALAFSRCVLMSRLRPIVRRARAMLPPEAQ